jgi:hypothetical protein
MTKFTAKEIFDFDAAQIVDMIKKDFGIDAAITKGIDGFTRITAPKVDVYAIGLSRAADKFIAAVA